MEEFVGIGQVQFKEPGGHVNDGRGYIQKWSNGISKREYFAILLMQGAFSNSALSATNKEYAFSAVAAADELIKELQNE
jgi:hypothetical protein